MGRLGPGSRQAANELHGPFRYNHHAHKDTVQLNGTSNINAKHLGDSVCNLRQFDRHANILRVAVWKIVSSFPPHPRLMVLYAFSIE